MAEQAIIYEGFQESSRLVSIRCYDVDGIVFSLWQNRQLLGTGTLVNSLCQIVTEPLQLNEYNLYLTTNDINFRSLTPQPVMLDDLKFTGWKTPATLLIEGEPDTLITIDNYRTLQAGSPTQFRDFPDVYDPSLVINKNPNKDSLLAFAFPKISFGLDKEAVYGTTTITVRDVLNVRGGYSIRFDNGVVGSINSKAYTTSGNYKVRVTDLADATNFLELQYSVTINTNAPLPTTTIENLWVDKGYGDIDGIGFCACYCPSAVEFQVVGVTMAGQNSNTWIDGEGGQNNRWYRIISGIPSGTQTLKVRVKANVADTKTITFIQ